jgi:hypothetical protein
LRYRYRRGIYRTVVDRRLAGKTMKDTGFYFKVSAPKLILYKKTAAARGRNLSNLICWLLDQETQKVKKEKKNAQ